MTASKDLHERIDRLSPEGLQHIVTELERQERIQRHLEALTAFQEGWTSDEQAAWLEGTQRRPWLGTSLEEHP